MMPDNAIHEALDALNDVRWRETAFADLQWYYAEGGVYVFRCKRGEPNAHLCIIRARSADEAIARAVFDLHKADEKKSTPVGDAAAMREALLKVSSSLCPACKRRNCKGCPRAVAEFMSAVRKALTLPPRNCDRFATATEAMSELKRRHHECAQDNHPCREDCPDCGKEKCAIAWLFATAQEQEGETK